MRRKEREETSSVEINKILDNCFVLHIGFNDKNSIYIVPVNFGYKVSDSNYTLYFHGAREGRKFSLLSKKVKVGFECETDCELLLADKACDCSTYYSSIIGEGFVKEVTSSEEKLEVLTLIMAKNTEKKDWTYPEKMMERVGVFKIEVCEMCCKRHKKI